MKDPSSITQRVFVVVLPDQSHRLFPNWETAEACADKYGVDIGLIFEFKTLSSYPDHLHLLSAEIHGKWELVGQWPKKAPAWKTIPHRIRLDHYHLQGPGFRFFRQRTFPYSDGLFERIDPMAPDSLLVKLEQLANKEPGHASASPVKPLITPKPSPATQPPPPSSRRPLMEESGPEPPPPTPERKIAPRPDPPQERSSKPAMSFSPPPPREEPKPPPVATSGPITPEMLKSAPGLSSSPQNVEKTATKEEIDEPKHRVWPMRLLIVWLAIILCWGAGIGYTLIPKKTAQELVSSILPLRRADKLSIEPDQLLFHLHVDPIHQRRYVQTLLLDPIPSNQTFSMPKIQRLSAWEQPGVFIRPPFSREESEAWLAEELQVVRHGFYHRWEDGSILLLDLESNALMGWGRAIRFKRFME